MPVMDCLALLWPLAFIGDALSGSGQLLVAVGGIAFLVFIHEGGHFLAAKWCGVRVEVFSLGFGKRLWGFRKGDTDYRISLLPLGGYVQMLGQDDADPSAPRTDREDDFRNKSVGQRALILVGGVAVNAIFAVVAFVLAFWIGVPFPSPEVGRVTRGGPADGKLETGDRILSINGQDVIAFQDVPQAVALSGGQPMSVVVARPQRDGELETLTFEITPQKGEDDRRYKVGVSNLEVIAGVEPGSPAAEAGVQNGDRITAYWDEAGARQPFSSSGFAELVLARPGGEVKVEVQRDTLDALGAPVGIDKRFEVALPCARDEHYSVGLSFEPQARVFTVLAGSPAERGKLRVGDAITSIGGQPVTRETLAARVQAACVEAKAAGQESIAVTVAREAADGSDDARGLETLNVPIPEPKGAEGRYTIGIAFGSDVISGIAPDSPIAKANAALEDAAARVQVGDRLVRIQTRRRFGFWWVGGEDGGALALQGALDGLAGEPCRLTFERDGARRELVVSGVKDEADAYGTLGFGFDQRRILVQRGFVGGLALGLYSTRVSMGQVLEMLRSLVVRRDVSVKELGGPIRIVSVAARLADHGPGKVIWFLALLSVNLAVLNILPIPVLDGGHLVFVFVEWLKGEPVSENVLVYAQWAGLFLILGLIVVVTFNDIVSLWNG